MMRTFLFLAQVLALLAPAQASAGSVYLNGVNIDGVYNQTFKNATVVIDAKGDVFISAEGYQVQRVNAPPANLPPNAKVEDTSKAVPQSGGTKRYYLVTYRSEQGDAQYEVDVFINSIWVVKVKSTDAQLVKDVTDKLTPGKNKVLFMARKKIDGGRKFYGPNVFVKTIIGEGNEGKGHVMIEYPLLDYTRTAEDLEDRTDEFTINIK